ncbi:MAG: hypothetical protein MUE84_11480, partial [Hyphomonas sp.]|nr:hypothetical protein [Hyphomonas sp.]
MSEEWMSAYSDAMLKGIVHGEWECDVGYASMACAHRINKNSVELSWYPNIIDRFHEVRIVLPRKHFVTCTEIPKYDEKPRIFVSDEWYKNLHTRIFSAFALVDAIGVKDGLIAGTITQEKLYDLRRRIDVIAAKHLDAAFVSFADSLLIKTNWTVGQWDLPIKYTYAPEKIIKIIPELSDAYKAALGLNIY